MAEEVYKILQSRLRKQAQHDSTCNNQYDCEGCRQSKHQAEECTKKKRPSTSGEVNFEVFYFDTQRFDEFF